MRHYIAFSITGTNTFITASTEDDAVVAKTVGLTKAPSRRPSYNAEKETKYHLTYLEGAHNNPLTSPMAVWKKFKELQQLGWKIDDAAFVARHNLFNDEPEAVKRSFAEILKSHIDFIGKFFRKKE